MWIIDDRKMEIDGREVVVVEIELVVKGREEEELVVKVVEVGEGREVAMVDEELVVEVVEDKVVNK